MKATLSTIEAVLGVIVIFVGMTFIYPIRETGDVGLTTISYKCLESLDQEGLLRYYIANSLTTDLNNSVKSCLPGITRFEFSICDSVDCNPNSIPSDKEIFVSSYLISGYETYDSKMINLWVWLK